MLLYLVAIWSWEMASGFGLIATLLATFFKKYDIDAKSFAINSLSK